ncbi:DMT family transporter [Microvirga massiliensis]|uniref:DMT family transporter n=1 Tax=Microvirga massiliensis TaxID=1033741 RepID=UPI00062B82D2|nr:DMT family transporter [Microvirga massiliensis]
MILGPAAKAAAGIAFLSIMDAVIKALAAYYPVLQVSFLRFASGTLAAVLLVAVMRPGFPSRETVMANGLRSVVAMLTATSFFYALSQLPLAEVLVLSFLAPMLVAVFAGLLLKERIDRQIVLALAAGFVGTVIVVAGHGGGDGDTRSWAGVASALFSAVVYALNLVLLRQRAQRDHFVFIVLLQNVGPFLLLAPAAAAVWAPPTIAHVGWFLSLGVLGVAGHVLMAVAFARAEAARLAPLEYTALIWAALIGYVVFDEVPTFATAIGAVLIIGAAAMASRRKMI